MNILNIKWGKERASFELQDPSTTTLGYLKAKISEWSHLPLDSLKLIHSGAVLKGDDVPLSSFRLRNGATIQVVGSAEPISTAPSGPAHNSEASTVSQIKEQLASVRSNLVPSLQKFLETLPTVSNPSIPLPSDPSTTNLPPIQKEHARISELLLQSLLNLDAIVVDREWEQARYERKTAVKEVQGYLDQLDDAWNTRLSVPTFISTVFSIYHSLVTHKLSPLLDVPVFATIQSYSDPAWNLDDAPS
ncbi:hypothetical protein BT96DRAFT_1011142 [Gymnopus androsaceus JB14]|uniref:Ubiquitin-like domain-containing protein n=1 Tax=Gymnopus androsaceus JB14 TaxID=1447944 RepID=A0A6A4ILC9_9AGAR|nr:hypothetical protein BT96DRAFT_1011142 [Gymnopus androsaceus JB14]